MEERIGRFTLYNSPPFPSKTFTLIISLLLQQNATELTITLYGMDVVGDMSVVAVRRRLCPKWYQNKRVARKPFTFRHLCQPRTKPGSPDHSLGDGKHNDLGRGLGGGGVFPVLWTGRCSQDEAGGLSKRRIQEWQAGTRTRNQPDQGVSLQLPPSLPLSPVDILIYSSSPLLCSLFTILSSSTYCYHLTKLHYSTCALPVTVTILY